MRNSRLGDVEWFVSAGESLSDVQSALVDVQIASCMTKLGWSYQAAPPPVDVSPIFGRFGEVLPDLPNGYMRVESAEDVETVTVTVPEPGEKYWLALNGLPGECRSLTTATQRQGSDSETITRGDKLEITS